MPDKIAHREADRAEGERRAALAVMLGTIRPGDAESYVRGWVNRGFYGNRD